MGNWKKTILLLKTKRLKTNNYYWPTIKYKKADNLEPDAAAKFLSYPIPKEIAEEWEKVK